MRGPDLLLRGWASGWWATILGLTAILAPALGAQQRRAHTIAVGETQRGTLRKSDVLLARDSAYAQEWKIAARQGQVVTIDLVSDSFDAYLIVYGPGIASDVQDDDSGGHCNARLTVRFPQSGVYSIAVTTAEKFQTGPFTLSVASGAKPKALSRCRRIP